MSKSPSTFLPAALLFLAGLALPAVAGEGPKTQSPDVIFTETPGAQEFSGQMIVRPVQLDAWLAAGVTETTAHSLVAAAAQRVSETDVLEYVRQTDEYIIRVAEGETETSTAHALLETGLFQYAHPNWIVYPVGVPNDPRYNLQWHHAPNRMQSADGWDIHTGNPGAAVSICDTGVRTTHEDLLLHRLEGYNAVDQKWESAGGNIGPVAAHGTQTTGCAAANGNNGKGVAGVGWNLNHRMIRVSNSSGGGSNLATLNHGARTGIEAGDKVASVSYTGCDNATNLTTATYIKSLGGLLCWAADNYNRNITYGNRDDDDMIVCGGTDTDDTKASFSSYGPFVDLTAPAVDIETTDSGNNQDYASPSGTSFATPLTAGLIALVWSYDPSLTPDEVEDYVKAGCDDLGPGGVDNTFGYGRINVFQTLSGIGPGCPDPTNYCLTAPNSAGSGALITSSGPPSVSTNSFYLVASQCPPNQFLMFYYGGGQTQLVFGNGWRCVSAGGAGIYRFQPFLIDSLGIAVMHVDFTKPPVGSGLGQWFAGDTWNCQAWFRDPPAGGAQFNLSDGLEVVVCP